MDGFSKIDFRLGEPIGFSFGVIDFGVNSVVPGIILGTLFTPFTKILGVWSAVHKFTFSITSNESFPVN